MNKFLALAGATAVTLGLMLGTAQAKTIYYDINGKRYAYDTTSPKEIAVARKLIAAANAADKVNALAAAERQRNPLVTIFGSETQRAAVAARNHLAKVLAEEPQAEVGSIARRDTQRAKVQSSDARAGDEDSAPGETPLPPERTASGQAKSEEAKITKPSSNQPDATGSDASEKAAAKPESVPKIKTVHFDPDSGIKTTILADGSIHEELFDPSVLAPAETTGSTTPQPSTR